MSLMIFQEMLAVAFDGPARFDGFLRCQLVQEDIGEPQDCRHRCANLMAHVRQELALGPVGGFGLAAGFFQPLFACRKTSDAV